MTQRSRVEPDGPTTGRAGHGRLKLFFGAAPGVGKAHAMLAQARQRYGEGVNVVVGCVNPRRGDEARRILEQLSSAPAGSALALDRVLERKPDLVLVEDLAHANTAGSRHEQRWQDVEELLGAGIDVYATLDVYELDSFSDVVSQVAELAEGATVPDRVFERADDIELIDLAPEEIIARLRSGQIAVPERLLPQVERFYSPSNLATLRELAVHAAADYLDARIASLRRASTSDRAQPMQQRLMVLVGDSPAGMPLVRLGKRLSGPQRSWLVAHVSRPGTELEAVGQHVTRALKLAEELGAETVLVSGPDLVAEIIDAAAHHNVTQMLVGRSARKWPALRTSLAAELLKRAEGINITIASVKDDPPSRRSMPSAKSGLTHTGARGYVEAVVATGICSLLASALDPILETPNLGLIFLTGVLTAAVRGGVGPALLASSLSFFVFNFFYTEPRRSFTVTAEPDVLTLSFFLLVALVTGQLAARVRQQIETIRANTRRLSALENFSRRLTGIVSQEDCAAVLTEYLRSTLALEAIVLFKDPRSELVVSAGVPDREGLSEPERAAAHWAFDHREAAGRGTGTLSAGSWFFIPLVGRQVLGVLGARATDGRRLDAEQQRLLLALRDQAGTALERLQLATAMEHARLLTETEKLRTALLSSISHDLRTPLVSIKGATTALLELDDSLSTTDKRELLENVLEETDRLNRYVQNLLDMTRLGYGAVTPHKDWCDLRDIIGAARRALRHALDQRAIEMHFEAGNELIHTDAALVEQILVNLLENAAKYSPPGTPITIDGRRDAARYVLSVCDRGPGIPFEERRQVFDLFRRARAADQQPAGTGMGLAICKGFAEALDGSIKVSDRAGGGTCLEIRLPQPAPRPPTGGPQE